MDEHREECIINVEGSLSHETAFLEEKVATMNKKRIDSVKNRLKSEPVLIEEQFESGLKSELVPPEEQFKDKVKFKEYCLEREFQNSLKSKPVLLEKQGIYPVPLCLKNDNTVSFYHPKEMSFGPLHFSRMSEWFHPKEMCFIPEQFRKEALHNGLEVFKSDVAHKFHGRLKDKRKDDGLRSLVEKLKTEEMQTEIAKSYPGKLEFGPEVLAWLLARDGCFVLEVLKSYSVEIPPNAENWQKTLVENLLNRKNYHPLLNDIVKDMFKLENQLPLWVLKEIKQRLGELEDYWFEPALKNLSPIEVSEEIGSRKYKKEIHLLQLLGEYMVDNEKPHHNQEDKKPVDNKQRKCIINLVVVFFVLLCIFLFPVFVIWFVWLVISLLWESSQKYKDDKDERHVPTIEELHKIGVKFKKLEHKGISHIEFDKKQSTLYLPRFTVDDRSEVILRNLLVMETHWADKEKIITRYMVLMNNLVNTSGDVSRLRQEGIISNKLGSDEDVARLWNSVCIPATDIPSYSKIEDACKSINDYRKKGLKILWAQFRSLHCSKPWLVASLLGGISLLILTVVQVLCLFYDCQKLG